MTTTALKVCLAGNKTTESLVEREATTIRFYAAKSDNIIQRTENHKLIRHDGLIAFEMEYFSHIAYKVNSTFKRDACLLYLENEYACLTKFE